MNSKVRGADMTMALVNGRIVLPDRVVTGQALVIEDGRIAGLADAGDLGSDIERVDVGSRWITPGLIDIHTHGALRHTFNEPDPEAWTAITRENLRRGTTALLATFAPTPDLEDGLAFCRQWMGEGRGGARVLGAYLESPYINVAQKGALDASCVRAADDGSAAALLQYADILRVFMLAPELPGALGLVEALHSAGIVPAAGHTTAHDTHVAAAMQVGLRHVTHLWSAMSMVVREGPWRKPGVLEAALTFDGLTAEIIADNRHLPSTLMRLAYKCLGPDRLCAVSDALAGAGLPEGSVYTMGGMSYDVQDGVGMMLDRSSFAGSATLLPQMLPVLIDVVGIPVVEAVRMTTLTPARIIGADRDSGSLEPGKRADLVVFDDAFVAQRVMLDGEWRMTNDERRTTEYASRGRSPMSTQPLHTTQIDQLPVSVYATNEALGAAAADEAAEIIRGAVAARGVANIIVATGNSQLTFLAALRALPGVPWEAVNVFHMDEYVNLPPGHPASFPAFLRRHLLDYVQVKEFFPVPGVAGDTEAACRQYEALLRAHPADLCACGIGENGHLAFNDPPFADFDDPVWVKPVTLDERSRRQQVGEGHFRSLDEAPTHAITLTIPALLSAGRVLCIVPEARKAEAVKESLLGPITEDCPGSILRLTPRAHLFLDKESASGLKLEA